MCLIITGPAQKVRSTLLDTEGLLLDVFKTNPDGIGVMYAGKNRLRIIKKLPKSFAQARTFIERMPSDGRLLAIHFRWTTHGDTDLENCHPYTVVDGEVALMHNGMLSTGNHEDKTKSDTWHFIKNYLHEVVKMAPGVVFDPGYVALVKEFIGSNNRFVFMAKDGRMIVLNKKEGLEHDGMWFSNTYAWTPRLLIEDYKGWIGGGYNRRHYVTDDDEYGMYGSSYTPGAYQGGGQTSGAKSGVTHNRPQLPDGATTRETQSSTFAGTFPTPTSAPSPAPATQGASYTTADAKEDAEWEQTVRRGHLEWSRDSRADSAWPRCFTGTNRPADPAKEGQETAHPTPAPFGAPLRAFMIEALANADVDAFTPWLTDFPQVTCSLLFHLYKAAPTKWTKMEELAPYERYIYKACIDGDKESIIAECRRDDGSAGTVAEVICYYLNWFGWPEVSPEDITPKEPAQGWPFPAVSEPASEAQLGQGGESDNSVYVG